MLIAMMAIGTRHPRAATPIATPLQPSVTAFRKARARCMVVPYTIRPPPRPRQARQHLVSRPAIVVATPACSERSETTWQASTHEEADKARTLRTKHGPLGCRGKCLLRENKSDCRLRRGGSDLAPARCLHGSRAVRALSAVSVLCPFLHRRNYQNQILP